MYFKTQAKLYDKLLFKNQSTKDHLRCQSSAKTTGNS